MRWQLALILGLTLVFTPSSGNLSYLPEEYSKEFLSRTVFAIRRAAVGGDAPVIAAAGDIACDPRDPDYNRGDGTPMACRMKATSDLLEGLPLTAVLALGDNQYNHGTVHAYRQSYNRTWGRVKSITHPVPGNHEYDTPGAAGYFANFGDAAGDAARGYYSFDIGNWHIIALNSNCTEVGGCGPESPQAQWLFNDLNALPPGMCKLAYWHHPRFSSGPHGNDSNYDAFWRDLYRFRADIILVGHDHVYERFAPQDPDAVPSTVGIRQFIIGTGGAVHYEFRTIQPNSEIRNSDTFGVLVLTLHPRAYDWQFIPEAGKTFTDSGLGSCH